jgi:hypothetical protein
LMKHFHIFEHVTKEYQFQDDFHLYQFVATEQRLDMSTVSGNSFSSTDTLTMAESSKMFRHNKKKSLEEIAIDFQASVRVEDRRFRLKTFQQCFIARDAVSFLTGGLYVASRTEAVHLGRRLEDELDLFEHVTNEHKFEDEYLFFRFVDQSLRKLKSEKDGPSSPDKVVDDVPSRLSLEHVAHEFRKHVTTQTHTYRFKKYKRSFVGSHAIDFLIHSSLAQTRKDAVLLGRELADKLNLFRHVSSDHPFTDDWRLYRYNDDDLSSSVSSWSMSQEMLTEIADAMRSHVEIKNRRHFHKLYKDCFVGSEAVTYLVKSGYSEDRLSAVKIGKEVALQCNLFEHVEKEHEFEDAHLFYRFNTIDDESNMVDLDSSALKRLAERLQDNIETKSHRHHLRVYKDTFTGEEAVSLMVSSGMTKSREEAVALGKKVQATFKLFEHVAREHDFEDKFLFYRFVPVNMRLRWKELVDDKLDVLSLEENWDRKLQAFGKRATLRRLDSAGVLSLSSKVSSVSRLDDLKDLRVKIWLAEFRRLDPRWRILNFFVGKIRYCMISSRHSAMNAHLLPFSWSFGLNHRVRTRLHSWEGTMSQIYHSTMFTRCCGF